MCFEGGSCAPSRQILPTNVKPSHYQVELVPNLADFTFRGIVTVHLSVADTTRTITANANDLVIHNAKANIVHLKSESHQIASSIRLDKGAETVVFEFPHDIPAGATCALTVEFAGNHNDKMAGFYRSGYTDSAGNKRYLVVTQCEATDCRRIFPCWDEPNLKATFDVELVVEQDLVALANMNVTEEKIVTIGGKELKAVKFARTANMSPYLFALAVGDFDYLEAQAKPRKPAGANPITCRTYTLKGQSELGRFALGVSTKVLEFFSEFFGVAYPLPKLDMIAIPDFGAGAMENWGLVTYREVLLLFDESKTSAESKKRIAYVIGHELAHQWFGNLVTMDWWNELWLNEGFATFVGWLATDHIFPEWKVWTSFVTDDFSSGLGLDALRSSHAIDIDVNSPSEINQIFDAISYSKGASVIRMLNAYLGPDKFAEGVSAYLVKHSYGNAKTTDLWDALSASSGKNVAAMMQQWTKDVGYPMVRITGETYDAEKKLMTLQLSQTRFILAGDLTPKEDADSPVWFIPIQVTTHVDPSNPTGHVLDSKAGTISFPYSVSAGKFYKLNSMTTGFYRVCHTQEQLQGLGSAIKANSASFTTEDRIGIISDAFAFARAGYGSTVGALNLVKGFVDETDYMVLSELHSCLELVNAAWYKDAEIVSSIHALQSKIFLPHVKALGYKYTTTEDFLTGQKRTLAVSACAHAGEPEVVRTLLAMFNEYIKGGETVCNANLRSIMFSTALKHRSDPQADFKAVLKISQRSTSIDERLAALGALGATNDISLVHELLNKVALNPELVKAQDIMRPVGSLAALNPHKQQVYNILWKWCTDNWEILHEQLAASLSLLGRVLQACVSSQIGNEFVDKVEAWARGDDLKDAALAAKRVQQLGSCKRPLEQGLERVRGLTRWFERDQAELKKWSSSSGKSQ